MSSFLRARQRTITALSPHPGNPTHLIPSRRNFLSRTTLFFAGDTIINFNSITFDASVNNTISYSYRLDVDDNLQHGIWGHVLGVDVGARITASLTARVSRGGVSVDTGASFITPGVVYIGVQEVQAPAGTVDYILAPGQSQVLTGLGTTGITDGIRVGFESGQQWIGIIADFKIFDGSGVLRNHWPIDDDVLNGGTIVDIVGGQDGTLTLGSGFWATPAINNPVPVSADFKTTSVVVTFDQPIIDGDAVGFTVTHDGNDRAVVSAVTQGLKEIVVTHAAGSLGEAGIVTYVPGTWTGLALPNLPVEAYTESGVVS